VSISVAAERSDDLRGYTAIQAHLAEYGPAWNFDRHQIYRLSQRSELPLPIDGPPGMPMASRVSLDAWVVAVRRRAGRRPLTSQLALFDDDE